MPIHLSFPSYILFDQHLTQINPKPLLLSKNIVILPPHINPKPLLFSKNSVIYQKKNKKRKKKLKTKKTRLFVSGFIFSCLLLFHLCFHVWIQIHPLITIPNMAMVGLLGGLPQAHEDHEVPGSKGVAASGWIWQQLSPTSPTSHAAARRHAAP